MGHKEKGISTAHATGGLAFAHVVGNGDVLLKRWLKNSRLRSSPRITLTGQGFLKFLSIQICRVMALLLISLLSRSVRFHW